MVAQQWRGWALCRLGDAERYAPYPEPAPAVFGVGPAVPDDEVGPETVHGQRVFQPAVEVLERGFGDQKEREPISEADLIPSLRK